MVWSLLADLRFALGARILARDDCLVCHDKSSGLPHVSDTVMERVSFVYFILLTEFHDRVNVYLPSPACLVEQGTQFIASSYRSHARLCCVEFGRKLTFKWHVSCITNE